MVGVSSSSVAPCNAGTIGPGRVVLVVGSSGAGKDAILNEVRMLLANDGCFVFPRRIVTRAPSTTEDNKAVSAEEFELLVRQGALALDWNAHGLRYGLPVAVDDAVHRGCTVVFNASRQVVTAARSRYICAVVHIHAPVSVRAQRLAVRRREQPQEIAERLLRAVPNFDANQADLLIDNAGSLSEASRLFATWLLKSAGRCI